MSALRDLRQSFRSLSRTPGLTLIAVVTLGLGIGANTAMFSILHAVLLQPLPYAEPDRLVTVWETFPMAGARGQGTLCLPRFTAWRNQNHTFEAMAIGEGRAFVLVSASERLSAWAATADFLRVLGVAPQLGRGFRRDEDQAGRDRVAVISHALWQRSFGGKPDILNRQFATTDGAYTVVGVMPEGFQYPPGARTDVWIPLAHGDSYAEPHLMHSYFGIGRLKPEVSLQQARAEMSTLTRHLETGLNEEDARGVQMTGLLESHVGNVQPVLWLLFGAVSLVLLIACVNVSNLLLGRAASRRAEVAIRTALGAGRGRLLSQFLFESLVLAAAGAALGLVLAAWIVELLKIVPYSVPRLEETALSMPVLAFTVAAALLSSVLFGVLPALHATRLNVSDTLRNGARGSSARGRTRAVLVVAEVGLTIVLLVGATLLMRSLARLQSAPAGFNTHHLVRFRMPLPQSRYADSAAVAAFYRRLSESLEALPGVNSVGAISLLPPVEWGSNGTFRVEGLPSANESDLPFAEIRFVTPGYFAAAGIPLLRGRMLSEADGNPKAACAILVNDSFVTRYLRDLDPIGRKAGDCAIAGVVGDVRNAGIAGETRPEVYNLVAKAPPDWRQDNLNFLVRTAVDPASLSGAIRASVAALDPEGKITDYGAVDEVISRGFAQPRFRTVLIAAFAALALLLSMIGLYGVISWEVTQRIREIGIRMALGAGRRGVMRMVLWRGLRLALIGIAAGCLASVALVRMLGSWLFELSPFDPVSFAVVAILAAAVAMLASAIPARRATRVDPAIALRYE